MAQRYPLYAEAAITVDTRDAPPDVTVDAVLAGLQALEQVAEPAAAVP